MSTDTDNTAPDLTTAVIELLRWWDALKEFHQDMWALATSARGLLTDARDPVKSRAILNLIWEIEYWLPVFRLQDVAHMELQRSKMEACLAACAALGVYAGEVSSVKTFSEAIVGAARKWTTFSEALIENNLHGWKDWRDVEKPWAWLRQTADNAPDDETYRGWKIREADAMYAGRPPAPAPTAHGPVKRARRRWPPKSLSLTEVQHAADVVDPDSKFMLAPTSDPRAALIPVSTATYEDLDNAITVTQAVNRSVPKDPDSLAAFVRAKYGLLDGRKRVPDRLIASVLGVSKKQVNALQSRFNYHRKDIRDVIAGKPKAPTPRTSAFIPAHELMERKMVERRATGGTTAISR